MTYRQLIRHIVRTRGFLREDAEVIARVTFEAIREILLTGEEVQIPRLGTIYPRFSKPREWQSPSTGGVYELSEKAHLKFRPSRLFERELNKQLGLYRGKNPEKKDR